MQCRREDGDVCRVHKTTNPVAPHMGELVVLLCCVLPLDKAVLDTINCAMHRNLMVMTSTQRKKPTEEHVFTPIRLTGLINQIWVLYPSFHVALLFKSASFIHLHAQTMVIIEPRLASAANPTATQGETETTFKNILLPAFATKWHWVVDDWFCAMRQRT